jgi:hypothetical protein
MTIPIPSLYNILIPISRLFGRMPSSGMLRLVALVRNDFSKESITSIIRVTRIGELGSMQFALVASYS